MKAIETTGHINKKGTFELDEPIEFGGAKKVKVILLFSEEDEIDNKQWLKSVSNPSFDFLKEPEEDIYTAKDGKPFRK